jgi:hypothetical protein
MLYRATVPGIDAARALNLSDWSGLGRDDGLHVDCGHLGVDADRRIVVYGSDGGLYRPVNADASQWTHAPERRSGLNSYQISDLAGTNVIGRASSVVYFGTQDNGIWGSSDGGETWPEEHCADVFFIQAPHQAHETEAMMSFATAGCERHMFADVGLRNERDVPDVDESGAAVTDLQAPFLLPGSNWIRRRTPPDAAPEVWVSTTNGDSWRPIARLDPSLHVFEMPIVSGSASEPIVYVPCLGARTRRNGAKRIALLRLDDVLGSGIRDYEDRDLIYLPNDGTFGERATMFAWRVMFGVNPADPQHLIAPDVHNNLMMASRDSGGSWYPDYGLTDVVTQGGRLLLYDDAYDAEYRMQVTQISFRPDRPDHIYIGTQLAGIVRSTDGGRTWWAVTGSQKILYITGFFFMRSGPVLISSYGRGLWKYDCRTLLGPFPYHKLCAGRRYPARRVPGSVPQPRRRPSCRIRRPATGELIEPASWEWEKTEVIAVFDGRINGIAIRGGRLVEIGVTPSATYRRYAPSGAPRDELRINESTEGAGFAEEIFALRAASDEEEVVRGVVLVDEELVGIITGEGEWTADDIDVDEEEPREERIGASIPAEEPRQLQNQPYLILSTNEISAGPPVIAPDNVLHVFAARFDPTAEDVHVTLDGERNGLTLRIDKDGTVRSELHVPEDLDVGLHEVGLGQPAGNGTFTATDRFLKARIDYEEGPQDAKGQTTQV